MMISTLSVIIGICLVVVVARKGYEKRSLSYSGAVTATIVGSIHILAGWRITLLLIFFYVSSSKLTKMWSSIKKQKEDEFHYGGERKGKQVLANSFIPTIVSILIVLLRFNVLVIPSISVETVENLLLLPTALAYYTECCADTWGSEVGIISSKPYLLFLPWKPVPAGTNGGISVLGMGASLMASVCMFILYMLIQPASPSLPSVEILLLTLFSSLFGNFIDSLLGSVVEESWWCAARKKIVKLSSSNPSCCEVALKEKRRVSGFEPCECGLVSGAKLWSGNEVNLVSSSLTSLLVFIGLFIKYFM